MGVNQSARVKHHIKGDEEVNFDHFQILRAIGKGSFGKVCIVQKNDTGTMYAMKYMNKAACLERFALRNVLREIEILTQLDHPFLVNLWFSFHDEEDMFLVQDLLLGGDLRYHLTQNVQFSLQSVLLYVEEMALALDYLQTKRIIHRDLKPANILLCSVGHAHLTDFNVATKLEVGHYAVSMSGTKAYMAPEIFTSSEEGRGYDMAVDWYSLGVVTYELILGRRPYDIHSHTTSRDIRLMLMIPPEFPAYWVPDFTELVSKLLCPNPKKRLKTLDELKELRAFKEVDWTAVYEKRVNPVFTPPQGHLNCDPTFELEEMIVESKPLHKKRKRLAKQRSLREVQTSSSAEQESTLDPLAEEFTTFNRQKELERVERERKEREWEEELRKAMEASEVGSPTTTIDNIKERISTASPQQSSSAASIPTGSEDNITLSEPSTSLTGSLSSKKSNWSKSRSATMPEGDDVWKKPE